MGLVLSGSDIVEDTVSESIVEDKESSCPVAELATVVVEVLDGVSPSVDISSEDISSSVLSG